ncbi:hypothetical protein GP419_002620 [Enterococcus faecalis]|nr:hypothetical protein [Enterococcus faecalis]
MLPEEICNLFLTKIQVQKLTIIYEMHSNKLQLFEIETFLDEPRKKIKRVAESLKLDISEYSRKKKKKCSLIIEKEKIYFSPDICDEEFVNLKSFLQEEYLQASGAYRGLLYILEKRCFSIIKLAKHLSYSESYTYKIMKKIKEFLIVMDLDIFISKKNETILQLIGDEVSIRLLHYLTIHYVSVNETWWFQTIHKHQIDAEYSFLNSNRMKKLSKSNLQRVHIILAINELAIKKGCLSKDLPSSVIHLGKIINKEKELSRYLKDLNKKRSGKTNKLHEEVLQFASILNYFTQELRTKEEKINIGKEIVSNEGNEIAKPCLSLLNQICKKYEISKDIYYILVYQLCNRLIVIHYLNYFKFMKFDKRQVLKGETEKYIESIVKESLGKYCSEESYQKLLLSFTQVVISYLTLSSVASLKIYIEFHRSPEYKVIIENILAHNYRKQVLRIVDDYKEADIVISDTFVPGDKEKFFYFQDVFDSTAWYNLGTYLNEIIQKSLTL